MESKQSSISIWTRTSIFNKWNEKFLKPYDKWGLYWQCTDYDDIHRLFKIPYDDIMNIMYVLSKELHMNYHDMNEMPFFEILSILLLYSENMEEQQKQNDAENNRIERQMSSMQKQYNYNDIKNQMNNILAPKFNMPNFNTKI